MCGIPTLSGSFFINISLLNERSLCDFPYLNKKDTEPRIACILT